MGKLVRCTHCRGTYDLWDIEVIARYAECTVFKAPCCGRTVDDRKWKSLPDFTEVDKAPRKVDINGREYGPKA